MTGRITIAVVLSMVGLLIGGLVGLAAAVVSVVNASRPREIMRWLVMPLFVAMVVATVVEGRLAQDMRFAEARPVAHLLGLALTVILIVLAVTARWSESESEREP